MLGYLFSKPEGCVGTACKRGTQTSHLVQNRNHNDNTLSQDDGRGNNDKIALVLISILVIIHSNISRGTGSIETFS